MTDPTGSVVRRTTYKPFGEDRQDVTTTFTPKFQFTGKEKEQDGSGFYDYGARIYAPATGRWLSSDPDVKDGLNRYAYVRNNPLRYVDPTGHQAVSQSDDDEPTAEVKSESTQAPSKAEKEAFIAEAQRLDCLAKASNDYTHRLELERFLTYSALERANQVAVEDPNFEHRFTRVQNPETGEAGWEDVVTAEDVWRESVSNALAGC
jgi:RHS repeat-associated protein